MKLADDLHNLLTKDKQLNGNGNFSNELRKGFHPF